MDCVLINVDFNAGVNHTGGCRYERGKEASHSNNELIVSLVYAAGSGLEK